MMYTRVGFELTIEQGFQSTVKYVQSTFRSFQKTVLYLLDITCNDECDRWCATDCKSRSSSSSSSSSSSGSDPDRLPEPEMDEVPAPVALAPAEATVQVLPVGKTEAPTHRKACWDVEDDETQCLNGGSCFAIELHNGMRRSGCSCGPRWTGERCEMRYIDPSLWADAYDSSYRAASISAEIGLLIIASFLLLSVGSLILRHQKRRPLIRISTGARGQPVKNGQQPVMHDQFFNIPFVVSDCRFASMDDIHDSLQKSNMTNANDITKQTFAGWQCTEERIVLEHPPPSSSLPSQSPPLPLLPPTKDSRTAVQHAIPSASQPTRSVNPMPDKSSNVLIVVQPAADGDVIVT